ncbi:MAG: YHS domain-containing (seleno)protein [Planctomycetota bacterium]
MRQLFAVSVGVLLSLPFIGCAGPRTSFEAGESSILTDGSGVALGGYDPVSYFEEGGPVRGSAELTATHSGATYWFATAAHRDAFSANPERYAPAFGGWCAWAVAGDEGALVEVDPQSFLIQDGRLLLFYDGMFADTRKMWIDEDPAALLRGADANWERLEASAR